MCALFKSEQVTCTALASFDIYMQIYYIVAHITIGTTDMPVEYVPLGQLEAQELIRKAKSLGIDTSSAELGSGEEYVTAVRAAITKKLALSSSWLIRMEEYAIRRRKIAAAYLAGASLRQLAALYGTQAPTIHALVEKELPLRIRDQTARERMAAGKRREPKWPPSVVSTMLAAVSDNEARERDVFSLAAKMQEAALGYSDNEPNDPYGPAPDRRVNEDNTDLRHATETAPTDAGSGPLRREDGDRRASGKTGGTTESDS